MALNAPTGPAADLTARAFLRETTVDERPRSCYAGAVVLVLAARAGRSAPRSTSQVEISHPEEVAMDSPADHHPIRVAIVDDQEGVHQMLDAFLAPAPDIEIVGAALDGAEGLRRVRELRPDVLILDERLGGRPSGREVAAAVRAELPAVAILAFTAYDDLHAYQAFDRGRQRPWARVG